MQEQKQGTCRTLSTFVVVCSRSRSRLRKRAGIYLLRPGPWRIADWYPVAAGTSSRRSNSSCRLLVYGVNETGLNLPPARSEKAQVCHGPEGGRGQYIWMSGLPPERAAMERRRGCDYRQFTNLQRLTRSRSWPMPPREVLVQHCEPCPVAATAATACSLLACVRSRRICGMSQGHAWSLRRSPQHQGQRQLQRRRRRPACLVSPSATCLHCHHQHAPTSFLAPSTRLCLSRSATSRPSSTWRHMSRAGLRRPTRPSSS